MSAVALKTPELVSLALEYCADSGPEPYHTQGTLFSCLQVNWLFFDQAVRLLWRDTRLPQLSRVNPQERRHFYAQFVKRLHLVFATDSKAGDVLESCRGLSFPGLYALDVDYDGPYNDSSFHKKITDYLNDILTPGITHLRFPYMPMLSREFLQLVQTRLTSLEMLCVDTRYEPPQSRWGPWEEFIRDGKFRHAILKADILDHRLLDALSETDVEVVESNVDGTALQNVLAEPGSRFQKLHTLTKVVQVRTPECLKSFDRMACLKSLHLSSLVHGDTIRLIAEILPTLQHLEVVIDDKLYPSGLLKLGKSLDLQTLTITACTRRVGYEREDVVSDATLEQLAKSLPNLRKLHLVLDEMNCKLTCHTVVALGSQCRYLANLVLYCNLDRDCKRLSHYHGPVLFPQLQYFKPMVLSSDAEFCLKRFWRRNMPKMPRAAAQTCNCNSCASIG